MFVNKVKGLCMETNVDTQRILFTEVNSSVNLGISFTSLKNPVVVVIYNVWQFFHTRREELNNKFWNSIIGSHAQQLRVICTIWLIDLWRFCTGLKQYGDTLPY